MGARATTWKQELENLLQTLANIRLLPFPLSRSLLLIRIDILLSCATIDTDEQLPQRIKSEREPRKESSLLYSLF